ncbi:MAG: ribbon-helix-helix protein, CopG family [Acidobacteria bacterium]|nr:ribbon-helix-helix protein, CopG family [Acidobacteriota bacterium]MBI3472381.1 ribbon-helix-helix protein, CopG family [Candidatus Solibacter usitatus]
MRTRRTLTISLPPAMLKTLEQVRKSENRTRSELMREALRTYFAGVGRFPLVEPTEVEGAIIRRGREEFARGEYRSLDTVLHVLGTGGHQVRRKRAETASSERSRAR